MSPSHPDRVRAANGSPLTTATTRAMMSNQPKKRGKMLRRGRDENLKTYGFLVSAELAEGGSTSLGSVANRLVDGLTFMEDIGAVDVEILGEITLYPGEDDLDLDELNENRMEGRE